jgi:hypothetical protein
MKSYKYAQLHFGDYGVLLHSTDSQVLDWILAELKKVITNFRVSAGPKKILSSPLAKRIIFTYMDFNVKITKSDGGY